MKICYVRENQVPYMNQTTSKAIMVRNRLKNEYMKNISKGNYMRKNIPTRNPK